MVLGEDQGQTAFLNPQGWHSQLPIRETVKKPDLVSMKRETVSVECKFMVNSATQKHSIKGTLPGPWARAKHVPFPRPDPWMYPEFPELKEAPCLPRLTCVEAGMVIFLLKDALGLRVESEP